MRRSHRLYTPFRAAVALTITLAAVITLVLTAAAAVTNSVMSVLQL